MLCSMPSTSPTWFAGPNPCPIPTTPGSSCPTVPGRSPGSVGVSVTLAGANSSQYCAPKRKRLDAPGLRSTLGTPRMAARAVGMKPPRIALRKRNSSAGDAVTPQQPTRWPHVTSFGLDWPFTPKRRETKLAASSRQRSHCISFVACGGLRPVPRLVWLVQRRVRRRTRRSAIGGRRLRRHRTQRPLPAPRRSLRRSA